MIGYRVNLSGNFKVMSNRDELNEIVYLKNKIEDFRNEKDRLRSI